ncbi:MAG: family 16 glycosylhydrolase [Paraglaciecola sp.]|uniref:family 16 glycosylhydrolase n=1 Tax=Paraglaciecola sp. TaxID=1920173 RepID=UPI00329877D3
MNHLKLIKGACCALIMMSSEYALAGWEDVNSDVNLTQSRAALDRVNRVYFTYVTVQNTSPEAIEGPFRVLIDDATLPVVNAQGSTDAGVPYLDVDITQLMPGESHQVRVDFELLRASLSFTATLQNDVAGWELVWNDEFDGVAIDSNKWTHEVNCNGGGNNEQQCYTDSADNSYVEDGILKIVAKPESGQPLPYSSARMVSKEKGDWTYGRFEIRAKAPRGQGSWPAIWMLPTDNTYGGWPHSGEIDIFESVNLGVPLNDGGVESTVHGTLHYGESWPNNDRSGHSYLLPSGENPADDFHTYAIEWEEGEMRWYVDGVLYQTQLKSEATYNTAGHADGLAHRGWYREDGGEYYYDNSPFDERFHMILNFAVGGDWPSNVNQGGIDGSAFDGTNKFEIDYVRVYECSVNPATGQGCATVTDGYLESIDAGGTLNEGAAPTPIAPSDGIARDLIIFDEAVNEAWPAWDCCGGTTPTIEYEDGDYLNVVEFVVGAQPTVLGFNTNFADVPTPYDGSPMEDTGVLEFDLKLVTPPNNANAGWNLKVEQGGAATEVVIPLETPTSEWQHYSVSLKTLSNAGLNLNGIDVVMIFPDWGQGEGAVFRVDNVTILEGDAQTPVYTDLDLDFESDPGSYNFNNFDGGVSTVIPNPDISGMNSSAQIVKMQKFAGQSWGGTAIELDNLLTVEQGSVFSMKVWADREVAVLFKLEGMNAERSVTHSGSGWEELEFDFTGQSGGGVPAVTVIFDLGIQGGAGDDPANWTFYYDDIKLVASDGDDGGDDGDDGDDPVPGEELVNNGSFDNNGAGWNGVVNVVQEGDNNVYMVDIATAGNPWDVNLSQPMALVQDATYVLSFKAKTTSARTILAGLGLNYSPWSNVVETVSLTGEWQTFSYTMTLTGFGDDKSRVFFDLGGEAGVVYIDDVSVKLQGDTGGDAPVAEDTFVLISSTQASDIDFAPDTVGEWSTGTTIQSDVAFEGVLGWEMTSSANSPEAGNWGTVLAFQNGINGDFSLFNRIELKIATTGTYAGGYKIAISGNGVNKEFSLPVDESISTWQTVSLDTANLDINLSSVDWIAVYGIGGQAGISTIYVTDFHLLNEGTTEFGSSTEDDFVFISSDAGVPSDLIVDDDNFSDVGNVIFGEWSTGTIISDATFDGLDGIQLSANGSWGAVLALQGDISDGTNIDNYDVDLSQYTNIKMKVASEGGFERYALSIVSKIGDNEVAQEVGFSLADASQWNEIDIDLGMYGINLSNVSQVALFGVYQGGSAAQNIYITDLIAYDTGKVGPVKDSSGDKFVFFSSTGEQTDMIFDGDDFAHDGNMTINDWSTGTSFASDVTYDGLSSFELTRGGGWGAVLALMGDVHGSVQEYKFDVAQFSTLNFKIAAQGAFSQYTLDFIVDGAEFKVPLSVNSSWTEVSVNLADIPINLSKLTQIAIFGVGGAAGDKVFLTDYNLSK